jgi:hypothetical protein
VAVHAGYLIRFFDLSLERTVPIKILSIAGPLDHFLWQGHELIVLLEDGSLHGYDIETGGWRSIARIPGDDRWMRRVPCSS